MSRDELRLLTAREVAELLSLPVKQVYGLKIAQVRVSPGRVRWRLKDVKDFIESRRTPVSV